MLLAGCSSGGPLIMFYDTQDKPTEAGPSENNGRNVTSSVPVEASLDSHGKTEVPMPDKIAVQRTDSSHVTDKVATVDESGAGKTASLDVRAYNTSAALLFSAVVDGMTALNLPIEHLNSPSGRVVTDWVRSDAGQLNPSDGSTRTRYRYVAKVFRSENGEHAKLEVQTLSQAFVKRHWTNKAMPRKVSNELFDAVEEQLGVAAQSAEPTRQPTESANAKQQNVDNDVVITPNDIEVKMRKIKELYEKDLITQSEYDSKRKVLLENY